MEKQDKDAHDFIPVLLRKRQKKSRTPKIQETSFVDRTNLTIANIEGSDWIQKCYDVIRNCFESLTWSPSEISVLCLGLGSPTEFKNSLAQLAFITLVCDAFHIDRSKVSFYDPHFSEGDVEGLLHMGYVVPSENKRGRYTFEQKTLLFMPHCSVNLYESALRYNWNPESLRRILILGNTLGDYITNTPEWKLKATLPCLHRIGKYLICDPLPDSEVYYSAFNDTSLQHVEWQSPAFFDETIWQLPEEIEDDNSEVV